MKKLLVFVLLLCNLMCLAQLSTKRMADIADMKVERFESILDLTPSQAAQLRSETIKLLQAHSDIKVQTNIHGQVAANLEAYYAKMTSLQPQQLATLKLMDSLDRQNRKESYQDMMKAYGGNSDFALAVAAYNWDVIMPILVSYRKDLDCYMSESDRATVAEYRDKLITKYNFITALRESTETDQYEAIISNVQDDIIEELQSSPIPGLIKKYDSRIDQIRSDMAKHESKINKDVRAIYNDHMDNTQKMRVEVETELLGMIGVSRLMRDSFFILLNGDSRSESFKINALHIMANSLKVNSQF